MKKTSKILRTNLLEHPAVKAWRKTNPGRVEPDQIEIIKQKEKGSVYRLFGVGLKESTIIAKSVRPEKAVIERTVYEKVLPYLPIATLHYYGYVEEEGGQFSWLFLEDIGNQRYSPQDKDHRRSAARWLAIMHATAANLKIESCLPDRGPNHYRMYLISIIETIPQIRVTSSIRRHESALLQDIVAMCELLESRWDQVEFLSRRIPRTVIHGDCLTKNIHVRESKNGLTVIPFDWGGAGWGIPATDLGQSGLPYHNVPLTSPDFVSYFSLVQDKWSGIDIDTIKQLANLGKMFWALKVICRGIPEFDQKRGNIEYLISNFEIYASVLDESIRFSNGNR